MSTGLIVGVAVVAAIVALYVIGSRAEKRYAEALESAFRSLGLEQTQEKPFAASGTIDGLPVTYEELSLRSTGHGGGVVPSVRIRVTAPDTGRPDTALIDKQWDVAGVSRPTTRVVPTGHSDIDRRFELFAPDDAALALWTDALASPRLGEVLRYEGGGRIYEATIYAGQVTLVAGREMKKDAERQRRLAQAAVELAKLAT